MPRSRPTILSYAWLYHCSVDQSARISENWRFTTSRPRMSRLTDPFVALCATSSRNSTPFPQHLQSSSKTSCSCQIQSCAEKCRVNLSRLSPAAAMQRTASTRLLVLIVHLSTNAREQFVSIRARFLQMAL